uniref:AtpZ/AtpI family protein n=1 Tax=Thermodesulfobium narugense TaxID=184064 RepID=A0A7C5P951_9BACT
MKEIKKIKDGMNLPLHIVQLGFNVLGTTLGGLLLGWFLQEKLGFGLIGFLFGLLLGVFSGLWIILKQILNQK